MTNRLVILADLGCLRAYRQVETTPAGEPSFELIEKFTAENAESITSSGMAENNVSHFSRGVRRQKLFGELPWGEHHHEPARERRRRVIRQVAARLEALLHDETVETCLFFAAPGVNEQLLNELSTRSRGK